MTKRRYDETWYRLYYVVYLFIINYYPPNYLKKNKNQQKKKQKKTKKLKQHFFHSIVGSWPTTYILYVGLKKIKKTLVE